MRCLVWAAALGALVAWVVQVWLGCLTVLLVWLLCFLSRYRQGSEPISGSSSDAMSLSSSTDDRNSSWSGSGGSFGGAGAVGDWSAGNDSADTGGDSGADSGGGGDGGGD